MHSDTWFDEAVSRFYAAGTLAAGPDGELLKNAAAALMRADDQPTRRIVLGIIDRLLCELASSGALPPTAARHLRALTHAVQYRPSSLEQVSSH